MKKLFLIPVAMSVGLAACSDSQDNADSDANKISLVRTVTVDQGLNEAIRGYSGVVVARQEARRGFQVGGKLSARYADVGDQVVEGQLLAILDVSDFDLAVGAVLADLQAAKARLITAEADEARYRELVAPGAVSKSAYERQVAAATVAREQVRQLEAQLDIAQNARGYTKLTAEADGVVTELFAEEGQVVAAGQPIFSVARTQELEIEVAIPESRISGVEKKLAQGRMWAQPDETFSLELRELAPQADALARTFRARYSIDSDLDVRLGMTATVYVSDTVESSLRVPASAVFSHSGSPLVWVVNAQNQLERRNIKVARYTNDHAWISRGLEHGETVVAYGTHLLQEGQQVNTVSLFGAGSRSNVIDSSKQFASSE